MSVGLTLAVYPGNHLTHSHLIAFDSEQFRDLAFHCRGNFDQRLFCFKLNQHVVDLDHITYFNQDLDDCSRFNILTDFRNFDFLYHIDSLITPP